jgi:hypothetical protein
VHCLSVCRCGAPAYDYDKESCRGCFVWPGSGQVVTECFCEGCLERLHRLRPETAGGLSGFKSFDHGKIV